MIDFPDSMSKQQFVNDYWQQKPLLCRGSLKNPKQLITQQELIKLSLNQDVESRLIMEQGPDQSWQVFHGPQNAKQLKALENASHWTLLVQSTNFWHQTSRELLKSFDFIPLWRLDDVMISYASESGTVGPHTDHYDVFLIQLTGTRRWTVGKPGASVEIIDDCSEVKQIREFMPIIDEIMHPGDILYVPPDTAHYGVSIQAGMTLSVGFRSPALSEMMMIFAEQIMLNQAESFLVDPHIDIENSSSEISSIAMDNAVNWLSQLEELDQLKRKSFGLLQTQPKQELLLQPLDIPVAELHSKLQNLIRDPAARVAWYQVNDVLIWLFINGECYECSIEDLRWIKYLTTIRLLSKNELSGHLKSDKFLILLQIFVDSGYFGLE